MGQIHKRTVTKPLPEGATIFTRKGIKMAKWKGRTFMVTPKGRIRFTSSTYTARYKDGDGCIQNISTGCKDEQNAKHMLAQLEARAELIRCGVMSNEQDLMSEYNQDPLSDHIEEYICHLKACCITESRIKSVETRLKRVSSNCAFIRLSDLNGLQFGAWLVARKEEGMSAATWNAYRSTWIAFSNWCIKCNRSINNPFTGIAKANEKADPRRKRRAFTDDELSRLFTAATPGRRIVYNFMLLTGLRKSEVASLSVSSLNLAHSTPYAVLKAGDAKNRVESDIYLPASLVRDLREWRNVRVSSGTAPLALSANMPLFDIPDKMTRIFDKDLKAAGIEKRDASGHTVDLHSLRHTFCTRMAQAGVPLIVAQRAMRHSTPTLTANVYTHLQLLDVASHLESLPDILPTRPNKAETA